jgi:predicted phage baseplate assembly protein
MPLLVPEIGDRDFEAIVAEALARIPVHNPEWTNFNNSDPGVTLVQLFAFLTESLLYRSNRIPERNRIKFLRLLGIGLQPAAAAQGIVTFRNPRGPLRTETLPGGLEVFAGQTAFRTEDGLDVLPVEGRVYYKSRVSAQRRSGLENLYRTLPSVRRFAPTTITAAGGRGTSASERLIRAPICRLA